MLEKVRLRTSQQTCPEPRGQNHAFNKTSPHNPLGSARSSLKSLHWSDFWALLTPRAAGGEYGRMARAEGTQFENPLAGSTPPAHGHEIT